MSNITVTNVNNVLVVDSRIIAKELGIQHRALMQNIRCHQTAIEHFGAIAFEMREFKTAQGNSTQEVFAYLNEEQATFVMTLSRNTPKVIKCKQDLVQAFFEARKAVQENFVPKRHQWLLKENKELRDRVAELEAQVKSTSKKPKSEPVKLLTSEDVLSYMDNKSLSEAFCDRICQIYDSELAQAELNAVLKAMDILRPTVEALMPNVNADGLIETLAKDYLPIGLS